AAARVVVTLAARAAVFDGQRAPAAWRRASALVRRRRRDVVAAWMVLASLGAVVWIGGRLLSPVLQDTALAYPHDSAYAAGRELGHALLAVPLEAFLAALGAGVWTALYREVPERDAGRARTGGRRGDPWVVRALAALTVVTIAANAVPAAIDAAWERDVETALDALDATTIEPLAALGDAPPRPSGGPRPSYDVDAELDDDVLTWTTHVELVNDTDAPWRDVGVNVYPAAFEGRVDELPMADELLATDLAGTLRRDAEPGEVTLEGVRVDGESARHTLSGTALTIDLERPLRPGARASLEIDLRSRLPVWPDRFGVWDDTVVLGNWIPLVAVHDAGGWRLDPYGDVGDPFYSEVADVRVRLVTDARDGVVGTGVLTGSEAVAGDRRSWTFHAPAVRDAAYVVAPDLRGLERRTAGVTVRSWYPADEAVQGAANGRAAASAVAHYTRAFGPLPYDEIEIIEGDGLLGGMEYPGIVMTSAVQRLEGIPLLPDLLAHAGFDDARSRYVAGHEIAHQWWYATVGNDQVREPWLDEAFAEASTRLWLRAQDGDDRTWRMTVLRARAGPRAGVVGARADDFSSNASYGEAVYLAGSEVLLELRARIGAPAFGDVMRAWYRRTYLDIGSIDGFVATVRDVAGADAAAWLERYR
ncbi:MAG TPA: M1 family metallopeptidase, partial [Actinomycetota bacterium]|nr:M1 family metallopeptidase [Actinomycetota bacterium]